jgi:hypothetical protein
MNDTPLLDGKNVLPSAILTSGVRPAYLRSASRSRQGVWPAALACWRRPPLLRPGLGSPSEGEWAMSEARNRPARGPWPDQGDVPATVGPTSSARFSGCGWFRG